MATPSAIKWTVANFSSVWPRLPVFPVANKPARMTDYLPAPCSVRCSSAVIACGYGLVVEIFLDFEEL
jgi:hypothetical protein